MKKRNATIRPCLPKHPVRCPHKRCHSILVQHIYVLTLGYQISYKGCVTKLGCQMYTTAPCNVNNGRYRCNLATIYCNTDVSLNSFYNNNKTRQLNTSQIILVGTDVSVSVVLVWEEKLSTQRSDQTAAFLTGLMYSCNQ